MRVTTRLISAVAAALLVLGAAIAIIELVLAALGRAPWIVDWRSLETFGQEHSWDDAAVRLIGLALIAAGVVLLITALGPRPPVTLDSELGSGSTTFGVRRRSLEAVVVDAARSVDGVADVGARWRGRSMTVHVTTRRAVAAGIDGAVGQRVDALLRAWRIDSEPARVTVRSTNPNAALPPPPPPGPVVDSGPHGADQAWADWPREHEGSREHEGMVR